MKLAYQEVAVALKDRACIAHVTVPRWEVPILEAVHADVTPIRGIVEDRPTPSSDQEYDRLIACYGESVSEDGSKGVAYVAAVYGQMGAGRAALRTAMQACVLPADTEVTPPVQYKMNAALERSLLVEVAPTAETDDLIG